MPTTLDRPTSTMIPQTIVLNGASARPAPSSPRPDQTSVPTPTRHRVARLGLLGVRLAIGFEFLWAFFDKTFGLGYSTPAAHAWVNGGSPTNGFLSGVSAGPLQGVFNAIAGAPVVDWLFMLGLLGVGVALILGVALRPAAIAGATMLLMMYAASWPFATTAAGQPTGSTNPFIDDHIVSTIALIVVGSLAAWSIGPISRRWSALGFVRSHSLLR
jgi:thiosulfate dehydrogenase (quinone) large subunit